MRKPLFTGSGVAIVTPFTKDAVDLDAFGRLLDFQLANGTDAVIVCGTTGEASTMTYGERMRTIEYCVERVGGRVPVIAGSGSNATPNAIALGRDAERAGVDGLLVVTPFYNKATQAGLVKHYIAIADAATKPIILYDVPSRTGVTIAPETYAELAKHPNINGVKEAGSNLSNIQKTRNLCPDDFSIWSGNDDDTAAICLLGGRGVISVAANVVPDRMHQLLRLAGYMKNGRPEFSGRLMLIDFPMPGDSLPGFCFHHRTSAPSQNTGRYGNPRRCRRCRTGLPRWSAAACCCPDSRGPPPEKRQ